jgi:hypothetical protein
MLRLKIKLINPFYKCIPVARISDPSPHKMSMGWVLFTTFLSGYEEWRFSFLSRRQNLTETFPTVQKLGRFLSRYFCFWCTYKNVMHTCSYWMERGDPYLKEKTAQLVWKKTSHSIYVASKQNKMWLEVRWVVTPSVHQNLDLRFNTLISY